MTTGFGFDFTAARAHEISAYVSKNSYNVFEEGVTVVSSYPKKAAYQNVKGVLAKNAKNPVIV